MLPTSQGNLNDKDQVVLVYSSSRPNEKNEDRQYDDTFLLNGAPVRVLGVYDGHGGPWTSEYISRALPATIQQHIENAATVSSWIPNILVSSFEQVDRGIVELAEAIVAPVLSSIRYNLPFARQRNDVAKKAAVEQMLQYQTRLELALRAKSGSTALVAYIDQTDIHVANLGDCRAVLARRDARAQDVKVIPLSIDQDGHNPVEYTRVRQEHPNDTMDPFTGGRLFGMMPLTRSFGDSFYKNQSTDIAQYVFGNARLNKKGHLSYHETMSPYYHLLETPPYLTATPEVISHRRSPDDVFMIMASDGVWAIKGMTNEWIVAKTLEALSNSSVEDPSHYVMEEVKTRKPGDDVTIKVVVFHQKVPLPSE
ncbi:protein phosphatase 2C family protein [Apiospora marii]|uniref:protein phosphatase 2C family protein n=1 Tax=Apiospora marii TaxID=335849 RepID=UPI00312E8565